MNYIQLSDLQIACGVLHSAIIARNAKLGWVGKEYMESEDDYVRELIKELKEKIENVEKGDAK